MKYIFSSKAWSYAIFWLIVTLICVVLYTLTYYSWPGCDEFWSARTGCDHRLTFKEPWEAYLRSYMSWNQRIGNCMQYFVITAGKSYYNVLNPLFLLFVSLSVIKLAAGKISINYRTSLLLLATFFLLLSGAPMPNASLFIACTSIIYTWVAIFWLGVLTILCWDEAPFRNSHNVVSKALSYLLLFAIGFAAGMTNECVLVGLYAFLALYLVVKNWRLVYKLPVMKRVLSEGWFKNIRPINLHQYTAIAGVIVGSIVFVAAPALRVRAAGNACVPVNLKGVPVWERLEYWPSLMWDLMEPAMYPLLLLLALLVIACIGWALHPNQRRNIAKASGISLLLILFAVLMSTSYLAGAVPYEFSHLPSFLLIVLACVVMLNMIFTTIPRWNILAGLLIVPIGVSVVKDIKRSIRFGKRALPSLIQRTEIMREARKNNRAAFIEELSLRGHGKYIYIESLSSDDIRKQAAKYYRVPDIIIVKPSQQ